MSQNIENSKVSSTPAPKKKKPTLVEQFDKRVETAQKEIIREISTDAFVNDAVQVVVDRGRNFLLTQLGVDTSWGKLTIKSRSLLEKSLKHRVPEALTILLDKLDLNAIVQETLEDEAFRKKMLRLIHMEIKEYLRNGLRNLVQEVLDERIGKAVQDVMGKEAISAIGDLVFDIEESLKNPRW